MVLWDWNRRGGREATDNTIQFYSLFPKCVDRPLIFSMDCLTLKENYFKETKQPELRVRIWTFNPKVFLKFFIFFWERYRYGIGGQSQIWCFGQLFDVSCASINNSSFSLLSNNLGSISKKESNIQGTFHPIYKS